MAAGRYSRGGERGLGPRWTKGSRALPGRGKGDSSSGLLRRAAGRPPPWAIRTTSLRPAPALPSFWPHQQSSLLGGRGRTCSGWCPSGRMATGVPLTAELGRLGGRVGGYLDSRGRAGGPCPPVGLPEDRSVSPRRKLSTWQGGDE
jgi:hypothetical protein